MNDWKNFFASRTVWSSFVGLAALIISGIGGDAQAIDEEKAVDAILQVVTGLSFLASIAFRVAATRKLTL